MLFSLFERMIAPTADPPSVQAPPERLIAFYWHFVRQMKGLFLALLVLGALLALADAAIPVFIGRLIRLLGEHRPGSFLQEAWPELLGMGVVVLIVRPLVMLLQSLTQYQAIFPGLTNLIRWQSHWHVVRQAISFFQNDFAGRIASRVMEAGYTLRASAVSVITVVWYLAAFAMTGLFLMASADAWLALPAVVWLAAYVAMLVWLVPAIKRASVEIAYARSALTGRIVDSYTNILTVKLFARASHEDAYVRESIDRHTERMKNQMRYFTLLTTGLSVLSGFLVVGTGAMAVWLWTTGAIGIEILAMVLPLTVQISSFSGRVAFEITQIFEQSGTVHEAMDTIAKPIALVDREGARELVVGKGEIRFDAVRFGYGRERGVIDNLDLAVKPGERIGLVGRSGAGKSTLVNLLLRFHDLEAGRILVDGQDIAGVTQESLRRQISVVTQDTSLLHRSIRENIRYGRPEASEEEIAHAAKLAHAEEFLPTLEDYRGRTGLDAHVGERGVKLSGGQRQRIAIARVILKDAPILILDEATSALDSEVEAAIQEELETLMAGKTVIAIAHRLSTIAQMDRLVVLDAGRVVESGTHDELLASGGHYARLWLRQSGGFLGDDHAPDEGSKLAAE